MTQAPPNGPDTVPPAPGGGAPTFRAPGVETEVRSTGFLPVLLRFFVVPLVLVSVSIAVFAGLGAVVRRAAPTTDELVDRVAAGGKNARWQAAQDLANQVARGEVDLRADPRLVHAVSDAFGRARAEGDDPRVVQFLSRLLARAPAEAARPVLEEALSDGNPDVRLHVLAALAELGDPAALPGVAARTADLDPGVRTMAVFAAALLCEKAPEPAAAPAREALVRALSDPAADVRWNAAFGLARLGRTEGADLVWQLLHRDYVRAHLETGDGGGLPALLAASGSDPATPGEIEERVVLNALSAAWRLKDRSMIEGVRALASEDERSPAVRDWALRTRDLLDAEIRERGPVEARTWVAAR